MIMSGKQAAASSKINHERSSWLFTANKGGL